MLHIFYADVVVDDVEDELEELVELEEDVLVDEEVDVEDEVVDDVDVEDEVLVEDEVVVQVNWSACNESNSAIIIEVL